MYIEIEKLYRRKNRLEVEVNGEKNNWWNVDLVGLDGTPDCCIGHFGKNAYIRTPKGMTREKYKSFKYLINAIDKVLKNHGLEMTGWRII